ncbi:SAF domain-containing protein [Colwellia sp. MB3u-4]|uniref:SAF domain-containing protein n=1 Tax=Colwellia sp. MB3u-4 TaxID=2759822 RepID=UPI0015F72714|nr:SAF domain-containing protein [Colwellia sp. MB3u-4]MBA6289259.1 SAF domain-containing protein [Colwellia sp. MB3u-4]
MKGKLTGSATGAMLLFTVSGMLASALGVRQYDKLSTDMAWIVNADMSAGQVITPDLLKQKRIDQSAIEGTVQNPRQLMGKTLQVNKTVGSAVFARDLKQADKKSLSHAIPPGRVLYTLDKIQKGLPYAQLGDGDRFDVIVRGRNGVRTVARDVQLIGINYPAAAKVAGKGLKNMLLPKNKQAQNQTSVSLVVAVRPSDVYPLAGISANDSVTMVFHSAYDMANGTQQNIDPIKRFRQVEMVAGVQRSSIRVFN